MWAQYFHSLLLQAMNKNLTAITISIQLNRITFRTKIIARKDSHELKNKQILQYEVTNLACSFQKWAMRWKSTDPVIELQDYVVGCLSRSKLHVHNSIHTQLLYLLKATALQMLSHLSSHKAEPITLPSDHHTKQNPSLCHLIITQNRTHHFAIWSSHKTEPITLPSDHHTKQNPSLCHLIITQNRTHHFAIWSSHKTEPITLPSDHHTKQNPSLCHLIITQNRTHHFAIWSSHKTEPITLPSDHHTKQNPSLCHLIITQNRSPSLCHLIITQNRTHHFAWTSQTFQHTAAHWILTHCSGPRMCKSQFYGQLPITFIDIVFKEHLASVSYLTDTKFWDV